MLQIVSGYQEAIAPLITPVAQQVVLWLQRINIRCHDAQVHAAANQTPDLFVPNAADYAFAQTIARRPMTDLMR